MERLAPQQQIEFDLSLFYTTVDESNLLNNGSNNSTASPSDTSLDDFLGDVLGVWLNGIICLLGLVGNIVSVAVVFKAFGQSPMFYVLRAVAVTDGVFLFTVLLLNSMLNLCPNSDLFSWCHYQRSYVQFVVWPIMMMAQMMTVWLAVLVSLERFVAICYPLRAASLCTMYRVRVSVAVLLVSSVGFSIPRYWEYIPGDYGEKTEVGDHPVYRYFYCATLYSILLFFLPLLLLVFLNVRLVLTLKEGKRQWQTLQQHQRKEQNLTVIPLSIVLIFFVCGMPSLAVNVIDAMVIDAINYTWYVRFMHVANLLVVLNSASNFIIYFLFGRKFRQKLVEFCCCYCCSCLIRMCARQQRATYQHVVGTPPHRAHNGRKPCRQGKEQIVSEVSKSIIIQLTSQDY